jgi:O-antigen ligase
MLAILLSGGVVLALRPATRVWRPVMAAVVIAAIVFASGIRIEVRDGRYLSAQDLAANALSISGRQVRGDRNGTREWRLEWWRTIVGYTVEGPYFWTGKGFGVNLAQDDGFVVGDADDHPLRSPHNGHLTILARAGVPGALLWLVLQCGFALALLRAYRRSANTRADWWARVDLWILASWVTFVVDAAFDVVLEGPQAGIWFWSIFGFGIAVLEVQRRSASEVPVGPALPEAGRLVPPPRQHASV